MTQKKTQKEAVPKKNATAKKVVAPVVEPVVVEKKVEAKSEEKVRICDVCGKEFSSKYSGQKYCATCSVDKAKARRKAAQKRRKMHRKDELQDLRTLKADIQKIIAGSGNHQSKVDKITSLVE